VPNAQGMRMPSISSRRSIVLATSRSARSLMNPISPSVMMPTKIHSVSRNGLIGFPLNKIWPEVGGRKPAIMRKVVRLAAPAGPQQTEEFSGRNREIYGANSEVFARPLGCMPGRKHAADIFDFDVIGPQNNVPSNRLFRRDGFVEIGPIDDPCPVDGIAFQAILASQPGLFDFGALRDTVGE
jgi:hypothetical protein